MIIKKLIKKGLVLLCIITINQLSAQIETYNYSTNADEAILSDKYKVFVKSGNNEEIELQVLMSHSNAEGDWRENELMGRTFSFTHLSYNPQGGTLTFRVEKIFGQGASSITLSPRNYEIDYTANSEGTELTFSVSSNNRYIAVNFLGSDNLTNESNWQRHMMCIFIDPPENSKPDKNMDGVVVYNQEVEADVLVNASIVYFEPGHHDLSKYGKGGAIEADGTFILQDGQSIYIEGGAFVETNIKRQAYQNSNQKIYGRGILSGRKYLWVHHPDFTGKQVKQMIEIGNNALIDGVTVMESPHHGIVGRKVEIKNLKFMGWHCNNDGIRVGQRSEIYNGFMRCVDDHFYNFNLHVHDMVLWAGHNGAIMTYGWGGLAGDNTYNSGASLMENISIINPEWINRGNNNGLIMSQIGLNYKPFDYNTGNTLTTIRNITIEGSVPGLTNLKPRSGGSGENAAVQVDNVGYLGDLLMENITVDDIFDKGLIRGKENASITGDNTFYVKNLTFKNISIRGEKVTEQNKLDFFDIDANTTSNINFDQVSGIKKNQPDEYNIIRLFPNPCKTQFTVQLPSSITNFNLFIYNQQGTQIKSYHNFKNNKATIDISTFSAGVYFVNIVNQDNIIGIQKLIVK